MAREKLLRDVGAPLRDADGLRLMRGDERPAAVRGAADGFSRAELAEKFGRAWGALRDFAAVFAILFRIAGPEEIAQWEESVVGDFAGPDELPERFADFAGIAAAEGVMDAGEKGGALFLQDFENFLGFLGKLRRFGLDFSGRKKQREEIR